MDFNYGIANIFSKEAGTRGTCISPAFQDSSWKDVQLPNDWVVSLPFVHSPDYNIMAHGYKPIGGLYPQTSIGWYRKTFFIPERDSGRRVVLRFDGIYRNSQVWLNGNYLGSDLSGYIGIRYDLTDFLHYNASNVLVVRVDATQFEGWFYEGAGIYRHAWLTVSDKLHIAPDGMYVHAVVRGRAAAITVETTLQNQRDQSSRGTVISYIADRAGKVLAVSAARPFSLGVDSHRKIISVIDLKSARLWSLDDPYLYRVITLVKSAGKVVDSLKVRFGIRTILISRDKGVFLNGKHVEIQGVCCHQDFEGVGTAMPDYLQYYRVGLLKQMGANALRTSHNAPTPELLDACDSLGLLVLDENRLLNSSAEYQGQFKRQIKRDRNHPSVFMWSIGNEEGWVQADNTGRRIARTLIQEQHMLDPTRTCTYAADEGNVYQGINQVIPVRGFNYRISAIDDYHRDHPDQPVIGTEMGSTVSDRGIYQVDSIRGYVPDFDLTHPWWATTAEQWWTIAAARPWFMGGFVWTGFDYRGEPTPYQWPNINSHFGVMDMCGFPKNIYYYYQSWWSDRDILHIAPHWNWKGKEGKPIEVWVNSNADSVKLLLNGKSQGTKDMPRNGHLQWTVNYSPGILTAIGYWKDRQIRDSVVTTGSPYQLVLEPARKRILADSEDVDVVNVTVDDRNGLAVPDADELIHFSVFGAGRIIGVGNGDPSSHEPDQYMDGHYSRKLFNGKCQFILQSDKQSGTIRIQADAPGLQSGTCKVEAIGSR